jgi:hypothetical protein
MLQPMHTVSSGRLMPFGIGVTVMFMATLEEVQPDKIASTKKIVSWYNNPVIKGLPT